MVVVMMDHIGVYTQQNKNKNKTQRFSNKCAFDWIVISQKKNTYLDQREKYSDGVRRLYLFSSLSIARPECSRLNRGRRLLVAVNNWKIVHYTSYVGLRVKMTKVILAPALTYVILHLREQELRSLW